MELIIALLIGTLAGSGVWLLLRPRTFQVIIGLSLLSYGVNLFIFVMGWVRGGRPPFVEPGVAVDFSRFADPLPQRTLQTAAGNAEDLSVPAVIMRAMFPPIALVAVYLLLRGHNLPGGGFVAGLALAVAVILQYVAGGTRWAEDRLSIRPMRWMGAGLLLGGATGAGAWLFSHAFLTSHTAHLRLPVLGELHLPSAFLFDLGIFSVVVGATGLILIAIAHQSVRHPWS